MAFEATKKEWSELYTFFRLLATGKMLLNPTSDKNIEIKQSIIAAIERQEHDGLRRYTIADQDITITGEQFTRTIPRNDFAAVADIILDLLKSSGEDTVLSVPEVDAFLKELDIIDLEAQTDNRTDISLIFWHPEAPANGFTIYSRIGRMNPLLDGGRTANLKFELTGIRLPTPTINKVNAVESQNTVVDRMMMIERLGGILKYNDVADRVFRSNLSMIDLHFPRMLGEMVRIMHLDGITRISELTEKMKTSNPLKIKDELINKHGFYEHKMKQFLLALALGMRPAKIYNGSDSAIEGMILVNGNGELQAFHKSDRKAFEDFLFYNTRLEKGDLDKDKYGFLERENGVYYFKLNVKVGLLKR